MIEGFLLGFIAATSAVAGVFFLRFWRDTRDSFFLAFVVFFFVEAMERTLALILPRPNEGSPHAYLLRLFALLVLLIGILRKNYGRSS